MEVTEAERAAMRRAVALADRGRGRPHPNPLVGAVVLDPAGATLGEGWHARDRPGAPHAEVVALTAAGEQARGGTLVVTLEPCAHQGRTAPCVDAVLASGVRRVIVAVAEPTGRAGGGGDLLRASGVEVVVGVEEDLAARGNESWLSSIHLGRPFVTLKLAGTLDGRAAAADGTSQWITSSQARADAHLLRGDCDAIAVGVGTVLADDPALTVRAEDGRQPPAEPLRVVLDSAGRTPADARVLDDRAASWLVVADDRPPPVHARARVVGVPRTSRGLDLDATLKLLMDHGVLHVLVEGGPRLAASFVDAGLVDRVVAYLAPALMGSGMTSLSGGAGTPTIAALQRMRFDDVRRVGPDVRLEARFDWAP
ncbi:MAG TPA: bifunctional diaminohydroxyphosphoribosylaminopyrimidine deaminase/5-amino-6-(5-phosphoribosylamino)uracil reductase RibD [Mycobacteriales bacterium]|nr:bifunctional diaminohydroxyphosphoribosylaminopyrimidine deaminase/5-amino-6-(5-phosphoribosylamino)uracil reductase RibD [Mycobacteriales bacterium]